VTSPVEIRHIEQEAEIQELFLFRAEVDVFPGYPDLSDNNFFLEVEMLMHDSKSNKVPETTDPKNPPAKPSGSRSVAHLKYEINSISKGIHEYIQGNFIENYYSILNMCIHTVTTEFRYRSITKHISQISDDEIYEMVFKPREKENDDSEMMVSYLKSNLKNHNVGSFCGEMMARLKKQHEGLLMTYNILYSKC
jgi:hypothetical protein